MAFNTREENAADLAYEAAWGVELSAEGKQDAVDMIEDSLSKTADELHTLLNRKVTKFILSEHQLSVLRKAEEMINHITVE